MDKKLSTEEAESILRKGLKEKGFSPKNPDVRLAWEAFKEMSTLTFDCEEDELLFEAGSCDYEEKELFCLSMVRQFTVVEEDGEYDYMEQLHMDFLYEPKETLSSFSETIWSYDFDGDFERFLEAVEKSKAFTEIKEQFIPQQFDLYFDEI